MIVYTKRDRKNVQQKIMINHKHFCHRLNRSRMCLLPIYYDMFDVNVYDNYHKNLCKRSHSVRDFMI